MKEISMIAVQWWDELRRFANDMVEIPTTADGEHRYVFYRRKGHSPDAARRYALAYEVNMAEQKERRLSHGTGAE